jgi:hypothetical protein
MRISTCVGLSFANTLAQPLAASITVAHLTPSASNARGATPSRPLCRLVYTRLRNRPKLPHLMTVSQDNPIQCSKDISGIMKEVSRDIG